MESELDRVLEFSPLALGETFSTLVTLLCAQELTLWVVPMRSLAH